MTLIIFLAKANVIESLISNHWRKFPWIRHHDGSAVGLQCTMHHLQTKMWNPRIHRENIKSYVCSSSWNRFSPFQTFGVNIGIKLNLNSLLFGTLRQSWYWTTLGNNVYCMKLNIYLLLSFYLSLEHKYLNKEKNCRYAIIYCLVMRLK